MTRFEDFALMERENWTSRSLAIEYVNRFAQAADQCIPAFVDSIGPVSGLQAVDICCGQGSLSSALALEGADVVGLDFSEAMLEVARRSTRGIDFCLGDAHHLPFRDDYFDVAVCGFGICHLPDQPRALSEAFRVLRSGGKFAMTVWCGPDVSPSMEILYSAIRIHGDPSVVLPAGPDFHQFANIQTANRLLGDAGFRSIQFRILECAWEFAEPEDLCDVFEKATARASVLLTRQPQTNLAAIRNAMANRVREEHKSSKSYKVPVPAALIFATK